MYNTSNPPNSRNKKLILIGFLICITKVRNKSSFTFSFQVLVLAQPMSKQIIFAHPPCILLMEKEKETGGKCFCNIFINLPFMESATFSGKCYWYILLEMNIPEKYYI